MEHGASGMTNYPIPAFEDNSLAKFWDLANGNLQDVSQYTDSYHASLMKRLLILTGEFSDSDFVDAVEIDPATIQHNSLIPEPHSRRVLRLGGPGHSGVVRFLDGDAGYYKKAETNHSYNTGTVDIHGTDREIYVFDVDTLDNRWDNFVGLGISKDNNHCRFYGINTNSMRVRVYQTGTNAGGENWDFDVTGTVFEDKTGRGCVAVDINKADDYIRVYYSDTLADTDDPFGDTVWGAAVLEVASGINPNNRENLSTNQELVIGVNSITAAGTACVVRRGVLYGSDQPGSTVAPIADFDPKRMTFDPDTGEATDQYGVVWHRTRDPQDFTNAPNILPNNILDFGNNDERRLTNRGAVPPSFTRFWHDGTSGYLHDGTDGYKDGVLDGAVTSAYPFTNNLYNGLMAFWMEMPLVFTEAQRNAAFTAMEQIRAARIEESTFEGINYDLVTQAEKMVPPGLGSGTNGGSGGTASNPVAVADPEDGMRAIQWDISDVEDWRVSVHHTQSPTETTGTQTYEVWARVPSGILFGRLTALKNDGGATDLKSYAKYFCLTPKWRKFIYSAGRDGNYQDFYAWLTDEDHPYAADSTATQIQVYLKEITWKHPRAILDQNGLPRAAYGPVHFQWPRFDNEWWTILPNMMRCLIRQSSTTIPIPATSEEFIFTGMPTLGAQWNDQSKNIVWGLASSTHITVETGFGRLKLGRYSSGGTGQVEFPFDDQWKHSRPLAIKISVAYGGAINTHTASAWYCEYEDFNRADPDSSPWIQPAGWLDVAGNQAGDWAAPSHTCTPHLGHNSTGGTGTPNHKISNYARWKSDGTILCVYDINAQIDPNEPQANQFTDAVSGNNWAKSEGLASITGLEVDEMEPAWLPNGLYFNQFNFLPLEPLPAVATTYFEDADGGRWAWNGELAQYVTRNILNQNMDAENNTFLARVENGVTPWGRAAYELEIDGSEQYNKVNFNPEVNTPWEWNTDYVAFVLVKPGTGWAGSTNDVRFFIRGTSFSRFNTPHFDWDDTLGQWFVKDPNYDWNSNNLIPDSAFQNSLDDDADGFDIANNGSIISVGNEEMLVDGDDTGEIAYFRTLADPSYASTEFVGAIEVKAPTPEDVGKQCKIQIKRNGSGGATVGNTETITLTADWVKYDSFNVTLGSDNDRVALVLKYEVTGLEPSGGLVRRPQINEGDTLQTYENTTNPPIQNLECGVVNLKDSWALLWRKFRLGDYHANDNIRFEPHGSWKNQQAGAKLFMGHAQLVKGTELIPWHTRELFHMFDFREAGNYYGELKDLVEYPFKADEDQLDIIWQGPTAWQAYQNLRSNPYPIEVFQDPATGLYRMLLNEEEVFLGESVVPEQPEWGYGQDWLGEVATTYAATALNVYPESSPPAWTAYGSPVEADGNGYLRHKAGTPSYRGLGVIVGTEFEMQMVIRFTADANALLGMAFRVVDQNTFHAIYARKYTTSGDIIRVGRRPGSGGPSNIANYNASFDLDTDYVLRMTLQDISSVWTLNAWLGETQIFTDVDIGADEATETKLGVMFWTGTTTLAGSWRAKTL